jgi:TRAP-type C4-dicarboxylate transport system permease small subunit
VNILRKTARIAAASICVVFFGVATILVVRSVQRIHQAVFPGFMTDDLGSLHIQVSLEVSSWLIALTLFVAAYFLFRFACGRHLQPPAA